MIVVHGSADEGQLLLWGETPAAVEARRGRKPKGARPLPYDAGAESLSAALADALPNVLRGADREQVFLWLPTLKDQPVPSSPLIGEPPAAKTKPSLAPWGVTAFRLSPDAAVDLLCACVGRDTLAPGLLVGSTLAFWTQALRFAGSLVAREQFIPGVRQEEGAWHARWRPVVAGAAAQRPGPRAPA